MKISTTMEYDTFKNEVVGPHNQMQMIKPVLFEIMYIIILICGSNYK